MPYTQSIKLDVDMDTKLDTVPVTSSVILAQQVMIPAV